MDIAARFITGWARIAGRFPRAGKWPLLLVDGGRVSINLEEPPRAEAEIAIKDYSECEGVLDALVAAGAVTPPHRFVASGHVEIPICYVTSACTGSMQLHGGAK